MVSEATTNFARLKPTLCYDLILRALGTCIQKHLGLTQAKSGFTRTNPGHLDPTSLLASTTLRFDAFFLNIRKVTFSSQGASIKFKDEFLTRQCYVMNFLHALISSQVWVSLPKRKRMKTPF